MNTAEIDAVNDVTGRFVRAFLNWKLIGVFLFIVVLYIVDIQEVANVLRKANWSLVGLALLLQILLLCLKSVRWRLILAELGAYCPLRRGIALYLVSGYIGAVTPGRLGEFWKAIRLKKEMGVSLTPGILATLFDRGYDFYFYFCIGTLCVIQCNLLGNISLLALPVLAILTALPLLLMHGDLRRGVASLLFLNRFSQRLGVDQKGAFDEFERFFQKMPSREFLYAGVLTLIATFILFTQFWLMLRALQLEVSFFTGAMTISLIKVIAAIPISLFGLGTRDLALISIFQMLSLPASAALSASAFVLFVNHIGVCVIGVVTLLGLRSFSCVEPQKRAHSP